MLRGAHKPGREPAHVASGTSAGWQMMVRCLLELRLSLRCKA